MMNETIRNLIDSCRPQGDDLRQPEMQPLADLIADDAIAAGQLERSRQLDDTIAAAVQNVPTPAGLEQRLLTALADSAATATAASQTPAGSCDKPAQVEDLPADRANRDESDVVLKSQPGHWRRRRFWIAAATCATVLVVIAFAVVRQLSGAGVSYDKLVASALTWKVSDEAWVPGNLIWKSHPLPKVIRATSVARRQEYTLPKKFRVTARCYELNLKNGGTARVFVFANTADFVVPAAPPAAPMFTQGKCVAAWTSDGLVYVIVVDGPEAEKTYKDTIRPTSRVTLHWPVSMIPCPTGTV